MKIYLRKLSTKDLAILAQRIIESSKQSEFEEVKNHLFLSKLDTSYQEYYKVISKISFSGKGVDVLQVDRQRDAIFRIIKNFLVAYSKMTLMPHQTDAVALLKEFKIYGLALDKLNYGEQTIQLDKLIEALSSTENQTRIENLSLKSTFEELKKVEQTFKEIYEEQAQSNSELRKTKSASELRKDVEKDLKRFLNLVTSMYETQQWIPLYNKLNEFVKAAKK